jgi:hypothetical protein
MNENLSRIKSYYKNSIHVLTHSSMISMNAYIHPHCLLAYSYNNLFYVLIYRSNMHDSRIKVMCKPKVPTQGTMLKFQAHWMICFLANPLLLRSQMGRFWSFYWELLCLLQYVCLWLLLWLVFTIFLKLNWTYDMKLD